jgi:hypothetical protein
MTREQLQLRINEIVAEFNELQGRLKQIKDSEAVNAVEAKVTETPAV